MDRVSVECLRCGSARIVQRPRVNHVDAGECPRCGYVGWAPSATLNEALRRRIREQPLEHRAAASPV